MGVCHNYLIFRSMMLNSQKACLCCSSESDTQPCFPSIAMGLTTELPHEGSVVVDPLPLVSQITGSVPQEVLDLLPYISPHMFVRACSAPHFSCCPGMAFWVSYRKCTRKVNGRLKNRCYFTFVKSNSIEEKKEEDKETSALFSVIFCSDSEGCSD